MRIGRLEISVGEARPPGQFRRVWRRGMTVAAVLAVVGLPGTQLALRMTRDDDPDPPKDYLDADAADFVEANWERAIGIEDVYVEDDLALEDEDMEPLAGALGVGGIPEIALDAYLGAEDDLAADDPDCGVPWSLLAAIGRVESNHGRFGGAELLEDGYGTKPIRGIPLDGRPGVALIRDTDDGRLDDDTEFDRAVGPMQFIPTTWPNVAADANSDGEEDPDNIYDAATGAGVYLCSSGGNLLDDEDARAKAVRRYNNSAEYVRTVLSLAEMYEEGGGVEDLAVEDEGFGFDDESGFDEDADVSGQLGPDVEDELAEPEPEPAPAELPVVEAPPETPVSVGWPSGMNELPPAELPPPVPPPGEESTTTTSSTTTTVPPTTSTTVPGCEPDPEPAPASTTTTPSPSTTTSTTIADGIPQGCVTPEATEPVSP